MWELTSKAINETLRRNWFFFIIASYLDSKKGWSALYRKDCLVLTSLNSTVCFKFFFLRSSLLVTSHPFAEEPSDHSHDFLQLYTLKNWCTHSCICWLNKVPLYTLVTFLHSPFRKQTITKYGRQTLSVIPCRSLLHWWISIASTEILNDFQQNFFVWLCDVGLGFFCLVLGVFCC